VEVEENCSQSMTFCRRWYFLREQDATAGVRHDVGSASRRVWRTYGRPSLSACPVRRGLLGSGYPRGSRCHAGGHHRHGPGHLRHSERLHRGFLHPLWWSLLGCLYRRHSALLYIHRSGK